MAARRRRQEEGEGGGAPGWMVTYGDMMSLLLTFFVLLISFSTVHKEEFEKAIASLHGALGVMPMEMSLIDFRQQIPRQQAQKFEDVAAKIEEYIRVQGRGKDIDVKRTKEGLKLTMQNPVLFDTGEDRLKPAAIPILQDIAGLLSELEETFISIEGHTDNVPIRTERFPSNLELSAARAISVARFLIDRGGIDYTDVSIRGYGENLPTARNDSVENRQSNRRVEINVLRTRPSVSVPQLASEQNEEIQNAS